MRYRFFYHILFMPLIIFRTTPLFSGEIVLPSNALDRDQSVPVVYRTNSKATGKGELSVRWTDAYGRLVEDRKIPVELVDEAEIGFSLDLRRAVAMKNDLSVHFSFEGVDKKGRPDHRDENSQATFIARPPDRSWWDYVIMMWQPYSRSDFVNLKTLGINGSQYNGKNRTPPDFLLDNDLRWYAENIATDFYSEYHRWHPDRPTNWKFTWVKELYQKDPASKEAFKRHPSLTDAAWLDHPTDWTRDGQYIVFNRGPLGSQQIWILPMFGDRKPFPLFPNATYHHYDARVSPNGKWLAYASRESGPAAITVTSFPGGLGKWQIRSSTVTSTGLWRADGKELYFVTVDGDLMAASIQESAGSIMVEGVRRLRRSPFLTGRVRTVFDVDPKDGQRFIGSTAPDTTSLPLNVITNWTAKLKKN